MKQLDTYAQTVLLILRDIHNFSKTINLNWVYYSLYFEGKVRRKLRSCSYKSLEQTLSPKKKNCC